MSLSIGQKAARLTDIGLIFGSLPARQFFRCGSDDDFGNLSKRLYEFESFLDADLGEMNMMRN